MGRRLRGTSVTCYTTCYRGCLLHKTNSYALITAVKVPESRERVKVPSASHQVNTNLYMPIHGHIIYMVHTWTWALERNAASSSLPYPQMKLSNAGSTPYGSPRQRVSKHQSGLRGRGKETPGNGAPGEPMTIEGSLLLTETPSKMSKSIQLVSR